MLGLNPFHRIVFLCAVALMRPDRRSVAQIHRAVLDLFPAAMRKGIERIFVSVGFRTRRILRALASRGLRQLRRAAMIGRMPFRILSVLRHDPRLVKRGLQALADGDRLIVRRIVMAANRHGHAGAPVADQARITATENEERALIAYRHAMVLAAGGISRSILENFAARMNLATNSVHPLRSLNSSHETESLEARAERYLRHALELDPTFAEAWFALGTMSRVRGDEAAAFDCFSNAAAGEVRVPIDRHDFALKARANIACGQFLHGQGSYEEAVKFLRSAVIEEADFRAAHRLLGRCLREIGKYHESITHFNEAMTYRPHIPTLPDIPETIEGYLEAASTNPAC